MLLKAKFSAIDDKLSLSVGAGIVVSSQLCQRVSVLEFTLSLLPAANDNCGTRVHSLTQGVQRVCVTLGLYPYWLPGILLGDLTLFFTRKPNTAKNL